MGIRTGEQYVASLRDGRRLFIDGRQLEDVTAYAPMRGIIDTIAALHDEQFDPALRDVLTYRSPTTGDPVSNTYLEARTEAEFRALAGCFHLRALRTYGLMGRLTDFMSGFLMDLSAGLRALGKDQAAARAQHVVEVCREGDLQVTHALIDPQSDRSTLAAPAEAVHVVERTRGRRGGQRLPHALDARPGLERLLRRPVLSAEARRGALRPRLPRRHERARPDHPRPRELPPRRGPLRPPPQQPLRRGRCHPDLRPRPHPA